MALTLKGIINDTIVAPLENYKGRELISKQYGNPWTTYAYSCHMGYHMKCYSLDKFLPLLIFDMLDVSNLHGHEEEKFYTHLDQDIAFTCSNNNLFIIKNQYRLLGNRSIR